MKHQTRNSGVFVLLITLCLLLQPVSAVNILESGYQSEVYATFASSDLGWLRHMTFDSAGNLYITARGLSRDVTDGGVYRIDTQGNGSLFASSFYSPSGIVWGGDTEYGDYLYVADSGNSYAGSGGGVKRVDVNGNVTLVAYPNNQPYALALDTTGNYGNKLYTGTRGLDHIDAILPNGSIERFSDFPYNMSGGPQTLDFDLTGSYDNSMFVASDGGGVYSGIFKMDSEGNAARFAPEITAAVCLKFDNNSAFGGDMFVSAMQESDSLLSIYRISPDEVITSFADITGAHLVWFELGPDGAMYTLENTGGTAVINRITEVPEPASLILLSFGAILLKKRIS